MRDAVIFDFQTFIAVIFVYIMIVISPGPNFVLVTQYSLRFTVPLAFSVVFGLAIGATINAAITMFGVGIIVVSYPFFGFIVSICGGTFMGYLGLKVIIVAFKERGKSRAESTKSMTSPMSQSHFDARLKDMSHPSALRQGLLVNLLNPKGIAFFIGLYAPLISKASLLTKTAVLGVSFFIEIVWYGIVILVLSRQKFRHYYTQSSFYIDGLLGGILLFFGAYILFQSRTYW